MTLNCDFRFSNYARTNTNSIKRTPRKYIYQVCLQMLLVLSSIMSYYRYCHHSNTTNAASGTGTAYLHRVRLRFLIVLGTDHLTWRGGEGIWFLVSFRIFFSDNTRVRIFICFCRAKREFFFQNSTLGYMTNTLNQIIFFSSTKIRIFFSATLGIRIFF
jgi:hypothetical protein